jgi:Holliday junction resolvase RusA-like endonuclease
MTRKDKWTKPPRPRVARYLAFKDLVALMNVELPVCGAHIVFILAMPQSLSKRKKAVLDGKPHQKRPDLDNLIKALGDAVYGEDSVIWDYRATKKWGYEGAIMIGSIDGI